MEKYYSFLKDNGLEVSNENMLLAKELLEVDESVKQIFEKKGIFSLYWIGTNLAAGAVSWVGSQVMQDLFGPSSDSTNISLIIQELIKQFKDIVHQEIEQEAVRQCVASINATQSIFLEYLNAPTDSRLELCNYNCSNALAGLKTLHLSGYVAFINAVSLKLVILQEQARRFPSNRRGELSNITALIRQSVEYHNAMIPAWREWNLSLYIRETHCRGNFCGLWVVKNGIVLDRVGNRAGELREAFIKEHSEASFVKEVYPQYILPADEVVRKWTCIENAIHWCLQNGSDDIEYISEITKKLAAGVHIQDL